ncbi:MAG: ATP phosphoribosyltransferase regulatory subunit [Alphaproteobacteria bacterium]
MNTGKKNISLLPNGFVDLLPPDAEREFSAIGTLMGVFAAFGYDRVKPPLLEFEESLFAPGPGASMVDDTFRVMDPVSHRMMGLRSDITAQISRIACSRLSEKARPLRVTYANDVLRTKASQQRVERQFCQAGCEIVGSDNIESDIETCVIAMIGLKELGVAEITLDLSYPKILAHLLDHFKVTGEERGTVKRALERRSFDDLNGIDEKLVATLKKMSESSGEGDKAIKFLSGIKGIQSDIAKLKMIYEGVSRAIKELKFFDVKITIDPIETRGFKYYSGLGFTVFSKAVSGELGRGGRYNVHFGSEKPMESAVGFTLYMDTVRKAMPPAEKKKVIVVDPGESWASIRDRQKKGIVVMRQEKTGKKK